MGTACRAGHPRPATGSGTRLVTGLGPDRDPGHDHGSGVRVAEPPAKNQYAVNLCRSDGSVVTAIVPNSIARVGGDWARFLDLLGYSEESAAGRGTGIGLGCGAAQRRTDQPELNETGPPR